jgi:hypothetical protein
VALAGGALLQQLALTAVCRDPATPTR